MQENLVLLISLFSLPALILVIGIVFYVHPPKKINSFAGYRTSSSMKNQQSWDYAQKLSAKGLIFVALFNLIIDSGVALPFYFNNSNAFLKVSLCLIFANILPLIIVIVMCESKLQKFNDTFKDN